MTVPQGVIFGLMMCITFVLCAPNTTEEEELKRIRKEARWKLYTAYGDPSEPLYTGDSAAELLKLCGGLTNCVKRKKSFAKQFCSKNTTCIKTCTKQRLYNLCVAQDKVRSLQEQIHKKERLIVLLVMQFLMCISGLFLWWVGHFRCVDLPLVGNRMLDKPTSGIKYSHYMWIRWIILGNTNTHWGTHMKADSFVYEWVPLAETEWNPPVVPPEELEPLDSDHPFWDIASLREEFKEANEATLLQEYWGRIYSWAWIRYRGKGTRAKRVKDYQEENVPFGAKPSFMTMRG